MILLLATVKVYFVIPIIVISSVTGINHGLIWIFRMLILYNYVIFVCMHLNFYFFVSFYCIFELTSLYRQANNILLVIFVDFNIV